MKRRRFDTGTLLSLATAVFLLVFAAGITTAGETAGVTDEERLNTEISILNNNASMPNGDWIFWDRLSREFDVSSDQIMALRDKGLGFGEIAVVYTFADTMKGGFSTENVNKVVSMYESKQGWRNIASNFDVDLGDVNTKVSSFEESIHDGIKQAAAGMYEPGAAAGGVGEMETEPDRSDPLYN